MIEKLLTHLRDDKCDYGASLDAVEEELKKAQQSPDESYANLLWAVRNIVNIHHEYVNTYHILEKEEYYKAWCNAEKVEICCKNLSRNFPDFFCWSRIFMSALSISKDYIRISYLAAMPS